MRLRSLLAAIAASSLTACGGGTTDAGTPATPEAFLDAATTASAVITSNLAGMLSGSGASLVSAPGNGDPTVGCTFTAGHFLCSGAVGGGLSGTATVTLFAANGAAQTAYDPLTNNLYTVNNAKASSIARLHVLPAGDSGQGDAVPGEALEEKHVAPDPPKVGGAIQSDIDVPAPRVFDGQV